MSAAGDGIEVEAAIREIERRPRIAFATAIHEQQDFVEQPPDQKLVRPRAPREVVSHGPWRGIGHEQCRILDATPEAVSGEIHVQSLARLPSQSRRGVLDRDAFEPVELFPHCLRRGFGVERTGLRFRRRRENELRVGAFDTTLGRYPGVKGARIIDWPLEWRWQLRVRLDSYDDRVIGQRHSLSLLLSCRTAL